MANVSDSVCFVTQKIQGDSKQYKRVHYVKICEMIRNYIKVDKDVAARQLEAA